MAKRTKKATKHKHLWFSSHQLLLLLLLLLLYSVVIRHFILFCTFYYDWRLWGSSYIFYYYVCLSACGKYTPGPPPVPPVPLPFAGQAPYLPIPIRISLSLFGYPCCWGTKSNRAKPSQAKRWNTRLEPLVWARRFTVRWLFEWWRRQQRAKPIKLRFDANWHWIVTPS